MAFAPETADAVKLTPRTNGGWIKRIGKCANGQPRVFYYPAANGETAARMAAWDKMREWDARPAGVETWEAYEEKKAEQEKQNQLGRGLAAWQHAIANPKLGADEAQRRMQAATQEIEFIKRAGPTNFVPQTGVTIAVALAAYLKELRDRIGATGSLGLEAATVDGIEYRMARAMENTTHTHLSELNYDNLKAWILALAKRPMKKPNPNAKEATQKSQAKEQVSQSTALAYIRELKAFLIWCGTDEKINYILPRKIKELWSITPEAEEKHYRILTQKEFGTLYHGCINDNARTADRGKRRRLFLMLGLNCGFYFVDIVTTVAEHIKDDQFMWKLRRKTRKTNRKLTRTKWKLWPETLELLKEYMGDLSSISKNDIRLAWRRLCQSTGVKVPHSICRDTGAQFMEKCGVGLNDMYLAHARGAVADSYSHPDWSKLSDALDKFYSEFVKPAIEAKPEMKIKEKKKPKEKQKRKAA